MNDYREMLLVAQFLEEYADRLTNDGCNDLVLENNPFNRQLVQLVNPEQVLPDPSSSETLYTQNWMVVQYLADKIKKQALH
jgi:hypothetical protein